MRYRKAAIAASSVLALLLVALFVLAYNQKRNEERLPGTYSTAAGQPVEGEYYVLEPNGAYTKYRQFKVLEQGTYRADAHGEATVVTLFAGTFEAQILHVNGCLYEYTANGTIALFEKISDQSVYINISQ